MGYSPQGCKESEITERLSTHSQGEMSPCPSCRGVQGFTAQPVRQEAVNSGPLWGGSCPRAGVPWPGPVAPWPWALCPSVILQAAHG